MKNSTNHAKSGFILYLLVMLALIAAYLTLNSSAWGRHVWEILSTQPSDWHL